MKKNNYSNAVMCLGLSLLLFSSCKKQYTGLPHISDSIYGTYVSTNEEDRTGDWTDFLAGTIIKVKPGNAPYFTIAISGVMNVAYPIVFDSVVLGPNQSFSINNYDPDPYGNSPTGLKHTTGTGHFGGKKLTMNFETIIRESPLLHAVYKYSGASKTSDNYN